MHLGKNWPFYDNAADKTDGVLFRIILKEKTGKAEHHPDLQVYDNFTI